MRVSRSISATQTQIEPSSKTRKEGCAQKMSGRIQRFISIEVVFGEGGGGNDGGLESGCEGSDL